MPSTKRVRAAARRLSATALVAWAALAAAGCASFEAARLYQKGSEALDAGETDLAIRDLERAAQLLPRASEIQNHLGIAYLEAGRDAEAESAFRRSVDLDCSNAAAVRNLRVVEARAARARADAQGSPGAASRAR